MSERTSQLHMEITPRVLGYTRSINTWGYFELLNSRRMPQSLMLRDKRLRARHNVIESLGRPLLPTTVEDCKETTTGGVLEANSLKRNKVDWTTQVNQTCWTHQSVQRLVCATMHCESHTLLTVTAIPCLQLTSWINVYPLNHSLMHSTDSVRDISS